MRMRMTSVPSAWTARANPDEGEALVRAIVAEFDKEYRCRVETLSALLDGIVDPEDVARAIHEAMFG